jgi:DNA-binding NarL/FixJ family response regulator
MNKPAVTPNKLLILIVDDNMCFVERMIGLLDDVGNIGYINVASDYDEASRYLKQENPDLVLLDINLPGKNGIELLRKIKKPGNGCQVIMITNHADEYYREQCKELGADHFLDKSNDFSRVPGIISKIHNDTNSYSTQIAF